MKRLSLRSWIVASALLLAFSAVLFAQGEPLRYFKSLEIHRGYLLLGKSVTQIFEGATTDDYETTVTVTDPTADRTWTIPDATDTATGLTSAQTMTSKIYSGFKWRGTVTTYTGATDAIDIALGDVFILNRAGAVDAATLADPAAGDEGRQIIIQNGTTQANTITITSGLGGSGGSYDLLTFTNVVAANCVLRAYGTKWYLVGGHLCAVS